MIRVVTSILAIPTIALCLFIGGCTSTGASQTSQAADHAQQPNYHLGPITPSDLSNRLFILTPDRV
jgi:hypothetical protein